MRGLSIIYHGWNGERRVVVAEEEPFAVFAM